LLGQREKKKKKNLMTDEIAVDEKSMFAYEGANCSSHRMRAFMWDFEGAQRVP
jgi:hypothetical protein